MQSTAIKFAIAVAAVVVGMIVYPYVRKYLPGA